MNFLQFLMEKKILEIDANGNLNQFVMKVVIIECLMQSKTCFMTDTQILSITHAPFKQVFLLLRLS